MTDDPRTGEPAADLSFVLATERLETIETVLDCLRAQTARERLEVVLVSVSGKPLGVDPAELDAFAAHRVVEPGKPVSLAVARGHGVRASTAPFVHVGETHAFPHPDWAERLLESLGDGATAVVSGLENANPDGAISWANLLVDYGPWIVYMPAGEVTRLPPYNTAFERSFALAAVDHAEDALSPGYDLAELIEREGGRILFEPRARIDHANLTVRRLWLGHRFVSARARTAVRSRDWPLGRRVVYAAGSPLLPALLAARLLPAYRATRRARGLPFLTAPAVLLGLVGVAAGELVGFAAGATPGAAQLADRYELDKVRYASPGAR